MALGFVAAGIGTLIGLVTYLAERQHFPLESKISGLHRERLTAAQWATVCGLALTILPRIFAITAAKQAYGLMLIWAVGAVDRHLAAGRCQ